MLEKRTGRVGGGELLEDVVALAVSEQLDGKTIVSACVRGRVGAS